MRDEVFDDRDVAVNFFRDPDPVRFVSLSEAGFDLESEVDDDDLRFFASGFDLHDDSFCFLLVGGLCTLVANTLLVLRFLPVAVVDPGRSPVTGWKFSFSIVVVARTLIVMFEDDVDGDSGVSAILREDFDWVMLGWGVSKKTLKELRVDIMIDNYLIKK